MGAYWRKRLATVYIIAKAVFITKIDYKINYNFDGCIIEFIYRNKIVHWIGSLIGVLSVFNTHWIDRTIEMKETQQKQ